MPRELLLPIPHAIADKVHLFLMAQALDSFAEKRFEEARTFQDTADKLNTLAREARVIGW